MNSLSRLALASILAPLMGALCAPAYAQNADVPLQRVEISAPSAAAARLLEVDREFVMETGKRLRVEPYGSELRVRYGRAPARMLKLQGGNQFASADGTMVLTIDSAEGDLAQTVRLAIPASWL